MCRWALALRSPLPCLLCPFERSKGSLCGMHESEKDFLQGDSLSRSKVVTGRQGLEGMTMSSDVRLVNKVVSRQ